MKRLIGITKNKGWIVFQVIFFVTMIISFGGMLIYVQHINNSIFVGQKGVNTSQYEVNLVTSKQWSESAHGYEYGMQYDGTITNYMNVDMSDWVVEIELVDGCHVDDYWNGEFTIEENRLTIVPMNYNTVVEAGGKQTFGFILYAQTTNNIKDYRISIRKDIALTDLQVFWGLVLAIGIDVIVNITVLAMSFKTRMLIKKQVEFRRIINESFLTFSNMIDAKDNYTKGHSQRVAIYAREIARRMGLDKDEQQNLFYVALLHDIGKIGVPDTILKKSGKLDFDERQIIEQHVRIGGDILKDFTAIKGIEAGARYHHERYDGAGYTNGLKGDAIPLYGRIICVADAFDAMSSARCYRPRLPMDVIIEELKACAGTQFDPAIVPYMLDMIREEIAPINISAEDLYTELKGKEEFYNF